MLAEMGHEVHMFELAPRAVEYVMELQKNLDYPIYKIEQADARSLDRPDESADIVLLMGPLYHLTSREERIRALSEAARVLKKDGVMVIAAITRFGSTLWGLSVFGKTNDYIAEDDFSKMIERELIDGQHIRPEKYPFLVARSFFHLPHDLRLEIEEVGLYHEKTLFAQARMQLIGLWRWLVMSPTGSL